jgi:N-acetylneuraminic acid mutarotase
MRRTADFLFHSRWLRLTGLLWLVGTSVHAATLNVSPAAVSNAYTGPITLQISGLTNGEPVLFEQFRDADTNGVPDPGEPTLLSLRVADGQVTSIAGVRNASVPGDDDGATNAQIATRLNLPVLPEVNRVVGNYVFRVSSPTSRFTPVTGAFAITNSAYPWTISGTVAPATNALVGLLNASGDGEFLAGTYANATGNYSLRVPPGAYQLIALKPGFAFDISAAPAVVISNQNVTQNLSLIPATRTLSGQLRETPANAGLAAVSLFLESTNGLLALGFTDGSGNFTLPVTASEWKIGSADSALALLGCLVPDGNSATRFNTTAGNVSGALITVPRATALFHGRLQDNSSNAIPGVEISARDNLDQYHSRGLSDTNGNYSAGVIAGEWFVGPLSEDVAAMGLLVQGTNSSIAANQAIRIDFTAMQSTAFLRGRVTDQNASPLGNIGLVAFSNNGGNNFVQTAPDGTFAIGVFGGDWTLALESEQAAQQGLIGPNLSFDVFDGTDVTNINIVVRSATAQITGFVRGTNAVPLSNLNVSASIAVSGTNYNASGRTDGSGNYSLAVFNGSWQVSLACNDVNSRGYECPSGQVASVTGANAVANFTVQPIAPLQITTTSLPNANVNVSYSFQLQASGGQPPYNWALAPASGALPPGITLAVNGSIAGVASAAGTYNINVHVTDQNPALDDQTLTLTVIPGNALQITTTSLPDASVSALYSFSLQASGGQTPYNWSLAPGSTALPPGFAISTAGILSGVTSVPGNFNFTARVTDANTTFDDQPLSLAITSGTSTWSSRPFLSSGRVAPAAAVIDGLLYAVGGFDGAGSFGTLEVYNPLLGHWRALASMPTPRGRLAVGVINGRLYAAGGFGGEGTLEAYDPVADSWSILRPMTVTRLGCAAGVISNLLYVVGGTTDSARTLEVYDPVANTWSLKAPMPTPRYLLAAGAINNRLYAVGGANAVTGGPGLNTLEIYDPATDSWSPGAAMPTPRSDLAAAVLDGKLCVLGGFSAAQLEIYDPVLNSWTSATPMPFARGDLAAAALSPRLYALGGTTAPGQTALPFVEQYSPALADKLATVILPSDAAITAAALGIGAPSVATLNRLDTGDTSGLTFTSAVVGAFGSGVEVPVGAPTGSQVINISSGGGQNGFFRTPFTLPEGFAGIQLSLAANVDFQGRAFLNGTPITPALGQNGRITENGNAMFAIRDASLFKEGTNELLIASANSDGGASGAAFFALVTYRPVPVLNQPSSPGAGQFQFRVGGTTNEIYAIQFTTNLISWTSLFSTNPAGGAFNFIDPDATNGTRYYRTVVVP